MCLPMEVCCCCVGLELGTKIVAVVHAVLSAAVAGVYGAVSSTLTYLPPARRSFYALVSAAALVFFLLTCLMAYGTFRTYESLQRRERKRPKLMWPWEVLAWCLSILLMGMAILGTVLLSFPMDINYSTEISSMISVYFIYAVILYYSASVVDSRRMEMLMKDRSEASRLMRQSEVPKSLFIYEDII